MPVIIPPSVQDVSPILQELGTLGGEFTLTFTNDRLSRAFEITDELYEKWKASKGEQTDPASSTPDTPSSIPDTDPAGGTDTSPTTDKRTTTKGKAR